MRKLISTNEQLYKKIQALEETLGEHNNQIQELWYERQKMVTLDEKENGRTIGFRTQ